MELAKIEEEYQDDPNFAHMRYHFIHYVGGRGSTSPVAIIIGEAPGQFENLYKKPFCGPAGKLLDELMGLAGLNEDNTYLTNVVKYRPIRTDKIKNRTPTATEVLASTPYLWREYKVVGSPNIILPVGVIATTEVLGFDAKFKQLKIAGKPIHRGNNVIIPMVHPAFILRNLAQKPLYQEHWKKLREVVNEFSTTSR